MIIKNMYNIPVEFIEEAASYAKLSRSYTSNRHDFHQGGLKNKQMKMFEGKLGEKIFKTFLIENKILFEEDHSDYTIADDYDFILPNGLKIDIKTRTKDFHVRTLEMVEQFRKKPKDVYVSIRLFPDKFCGSIIGWFSKEDILRINRIENQGYLDNYVLYDNELHNIEKLYNEQLKNFIE